MDIFEKAIHELHQGIDYDFIALRLKVAGYWEFYAQKFLCYKHDAGNIHPNDRYPTIHNIRKMVLGYVPGVYEIKLNQGEYPIVMEIRTICNSNNKIISQTMILNIKELFKWVLPINVSTKIEWVSRYRVLVTFS